MNLEEKIKYYDEKYEKNGLPTEIGTLEFFDDEFLNFLLSRKTSFIKINVRDFDILLSNDSSFNKAIQLLLLYHLANIRCGEFYILLKSNDKIFNYIANLIVSNNASGTHLIKFLFEDRRVLELFKPLSKTNPDLFISVFKIMRIDDLKEMILDPIWKNIYYQTDLNYFFTYIDKIGVDNIGIDIINSKIESLNYEEVINMLNKYYNSETNEPEYMRNIYNKYENEIRKYKIADLLKGLAKNSSEETITKARELLNTNVGMEVFLSSFKIDEFEKISKILGFNPEIINNMRRNRFLEILSNYEMYSLDTIKNIFSLYYFEYTFQNLTIDIGVILKYADTSNEAKKILGSLKEPLEKTYNYLNGNQNVNPLEVIKGFSANPNIINEIMAKMYNLFNQDVNKSINSEVVLKNATIEEKNGVLIYHLDNKNEGMFLVHSTSYSDENFYKKYCENSENHSKICMSIFDANHTKPFVNGITFGYLNIENQLYSAVVRDAQTNQISLERNLNSDLYPINQFMNYTDGWNELTYLTNNKIVLPSYILCIDREPNDSEIKVAKDFGIPIYVYPRRKEIGELLSEKIEHKNYYDKSSRILIIPKELSKDIIVTPDETNITFNETNTHRL